MGETLIGLIHPVWWAYCLTNSQEIKSTDLFSAYTEQAEYDAAVQNQKKKRGKNSLYVSSSAGSSGSGSGINLWGVA